MRFLPALIHACIVRAEKAREMVLSTRQRIISREAGASCAYSRKA